MILVIVIASAAIVVLALAVLMTRRASARRRAAMPDRQVEVTESSPVATLRSRAADSRDLYAPAFIVEPGQCFRLCRDPATDAAYPCDRPVEGRGEFLDHRGNAVEVEACGAHMVDLVNWQFRVVDS